MVPGRGAGSGTYLGAAGNRPPLRLGHGQGAGHIHRSPHKIRLVPRAPPPLRPVAGVLLTSQAAPPALAPLAPATGRSPPPRLQSSAPRLRHRLPSSPRACGPRAAAAAHHFGSCLAFVASALISRSFVAVAAGPRASRHPPRKNFGRWGQAVLVFETVAAEPTESRCAASTFSR